MTDAAAPKYTNALAHETSPYLLQHAHNPVDWYPWGEEAIQKAKLEDKPIFLSIGYSACHWCHVMERESFENEEVAEVLNKHFISIKVDREERPDLDDIYMHAVQMLTGHGGWPMSVFLTPELKPFFGGTYFPPNDGPRGLGFKTICLRIAYAFKQERDKIDESSHQILDAIGQADAGVMAGGATPETRLLETATRKMASAYDKTHGGFGGAPKFPPSMALNLLLRERARTGDPSLLGIVTGTLDAMADGGIHDQILGGFARYSTDAAWLVPHFEKMLYDNAQLAPLYFDAACVAENPYYERVGRRVLDYIIRDMTDETGGYHSAEDADSEGVEGKYYVWTPDEVIEVLGEDEGRLFCEFYDITEQGNFEGKSIPNIVRPLEEFAKMRGEDPETTRERLEAAEQKLEAARQKRVRPGRDDKILTSWNALMISGMLRGAQVTGDRRYLDSAVRAMDFLLDKMKDENGGLLRAYRAGKAHIPGFIDDYAYLVVALIDLYETTFEPKWLEEAVALADRMIEKFYDRESAGFFTTDGRDPNVVMRKKDLFDNAQPSGNSSAVFGLLRLAELLDREDYRKLAMETIASLQKYTEQIPAALHHLLCALSFELGRKQEIAIVGEFEDPETRSMIRAVHERYLPGRAMAVAPPSEVDQGFNANIALLKDKKPVNGSTTAFVCENYACREPVDKTSKLVEMLG